MSLTFVPEIPEAATVQPIIDELARNPGQWADLGSYSLKDYLAAWHAGSFLKGADFRVETAIRNIGESYTLFARYQEK